MEDGPENPLFEAEFDYADLVGLRVRTSAGEVVGSVREVLWGSANDNLVVDGPAGEVLIPFIEDIILAVDLPDKTITIEPIDGLLDLNEKKK
jgi:16S rRNA processing protein RimM